MILTSELSIFHSFPAVYHLGLHMVCAFRNSYDIEDAAHITMILDIFMFSGVVLFYFRQSLKFCMLAFS